MDPKTYKFDTLSLHGGHQPDKNLDHGLFLSIKQRLMFFKIPIMQPLYLIWNKGVIFIAVYPIQLLLF